MPSCCTLCRLQDLGGSGGFAGSGNKKKDKDDNKFGTVKARPFSKYVRLRVQWAAGVPVRVSLISGVSLWPQADDCISVCHDY